MPVLACSQPKIKAHTKNTRTQKRKLTSKNPIKPKNQIIKTDFYYILFLFL